MNAVGGHIRDIWDNVRHVVELGTKYKKPSDPISAIQPHLKPCQDAMSKIRSSRVDRKFDWHLKAIMEMLASVSWVVVVPPPSPSNFVKDTIGASDFWGNKIRKEYKMKDGDGPSHITFCDTMKTLVNDLAAYLKEHHLSGLAWNPHGKDFSEAKIGECSSSTVAKPTRSAAASVGGSTGVGAAGIFDELIKKQSGDGSSAATGLKKVTREQQTWRKEYKKPVGEVPQKQNTASIMQMSKPSAESVVKALGSPKCEYQDQGCKWNVENQTKDTCEGGVCQIQVTDPKQQVTISKKCSYFSLFALEEVLLCLKKRLLLQSLRTTCFRSTSTNVKTSQSKSLAS